MKSLAIALALTVLTAAGAQAHAKLVKADPAVGAVSGPTNMAHLDFNEELSAKLSGAEVKDAGGKIVPATAMAEGKTMMLLFRTALLPGAYKVAWHAVASDDGHRTAGTYGFTVK